MAEAITKEFLTKQVNDLQAKVSDQVGQVKTDLQKEVDEKLKALESLSSKEELEKANKEIQAQKARIDKLAQKDKDIQGGKVLNFKDAFHKAIKDNSEKILNLKENSGSVSFTTKAATNVGLSNTIFGVNSDSSVQGTQDTGIIKPIRSRVLNYLQLVNTFVSTSNKVMWTEEVDEQGNVVPTAEMATKPNLSVRYEERNQEMKKYPGYTKVSTEMLDDAPQLVSRTEANVLKRLNIKVEDDLFKADGSGDKLKGIIPYATAFTGGSLSESVASANNYDVLQGVATQVFEEHGQASAIFITPGALGQIKTEKDSNGQYILPPFATADGTVIAGVQLIATTALIGSGFDFVGGDLSVVNVGIRQDTRQEISRSGDDMINNMVTILVETRLGQFVSANDAGLLVKGSFGTAKAALDPAVA